MLARVFVHCPKLRFGLVVWDLGGFTIVTIPLTGFTDHYPKPLINRWFACCFGLIGNLQFFLMFHTMLLRHVPQFLRTRFSSAPRNAEEQRHTWSRFFSMAAEVVSRCLPALSDGEDMHESQGNLGLRISTNHDVHSIFPEVPPKSIRGSAISAQVTEPTW